MRAGLDALAAGAEIADVSPLGCIQVKQSFYNGKLVNRTFNINNKMVSQRNWSGKFLHEYVDGDLDGFNEWQSTTVAGETPGEYTTTETDFDPVTYARLRLTTLTTTAAGVHVKVEERNEAGGWTVVRDEDAPLVQEVMLGSDGPPVAGASDDADGCEADPCDADKIKDRLDDGVNLALQCLGNYGPQGIAMWEKAFNAMERDMEMVCETIPGESYATIAGWNTTDGTLTVTLDPAKYCGLDDGQRAWLMFHEIMHAALRYSHPSSTRGLPLEQRSQLDRIYGCNALCRSSKNNVTKCMCAQCFGTVTCDPICDPFKADCGATCPCPEKNNRYYDTCTQCLVDCPSGLACFGYSTCDPVGQTPPCLPVTCPP